MEKDWKPTPLGGTDTAAILGMSPWRRPIDIWLAKTGKLEHGDGPLPERLTLGQIYEEPLAALWEQRHEGTQLWSPGDDPMIRAYDGRLACYQENTDTDAETPHHKYRLVSLDYDWIGGTPDRIVLDLEYRLSDRGLEIKTASPFAIGDYGPDGSDDIPPHYLIQCQHYMLLTGLRTWELFVAFGNQETRNYIIEEDVDLHSIILERTKQFWEQNILADCQPEIDHSESWKKYLGQKYKRVKSDYRAASPAEGGLVLDYQVAVRAVKKAEEAKRLAENKLRETIKGAKGITLPDGRRFGWIERKGSVSLKRVIETMADRFDIGTGAVDEIKEECRSESIRVFSPPRNGKE